MTKLGGAREGHLVSFLNACGDDTGLCCRGEVRQRWGAERTTPEREVGLEQECDER